MDNIETIFETTSTRVKVAVAVLAGAAVVGAGVVAYQESQKQSSLIPVSDGKESATTPGKSSLKSPSSPSAIELRSADEASALFQRLQAAREAMIKKFEELGHNTVPEQAHELLNEIIVLEPAEWPETVRLFVTQLIQDFWIMNQRVHGTIQSNNELAEIIEVSKQWLSFTATSPEVLIEQTNHRYSVALRSRSPREFRILVDWLDSFSEDLLQSKEEIRNNWALRKFQCACTLGVWADVIEFGRLLEKQSVSIDGEQAHPLKIFEYIALRLPNQSVNFTQVYLNAERYLKKFDARLAPPLRFCDWDVLDCETLMVGGISTNATRQGELQEKLRGATPKQDTASKTIYVFGAMAQFPCYWVRLPSSNAGGPQPVVLTGPWNDSEMELTASFQRRAPGADNSRLIRTNLQLCLDRVETRRVKNKTAWVWEGKFRHTEGFIDTASVDDLLNDFNFLRNSKWTSLAAESTRQEWSVRLVMNTPD